MNKAEYVAELLEALARPVTMRTTYPFSLGIDPGVTHPTAAILGGCKPNGHIHVVGSYFMTGEDDVEVHAKALVEMCDRFYQLSNPRFMSVRADDRDPFFWGELAKYTKNKIVPVSMIALRPENKTKPWDKAALRFAAVLRVKNLIKRGLFTVDPDCGAYQQFALSWASTIWDEKAKDERPKKQDGDDPMDAFWAMVTGLYPPNPELDRVDPSRRREPSLAQLVREGKRREAEEAEDDEI